MSAPTCDGVDRLRGQHFLRNMAALWRTDPQLALRVDEIDDDERLELEPTRSGEFTVRAKGSGNHPIYLHSRYDPVAEAEQLAGSIQTNKAFCVVVFGLGLGYHVQALLPKLSNEAFVLCVEPCLKTLSTALNCLDFSEAIRKRRLLFLWNDDKARLHEQLKPMGTLMMLGTEFLHHRPSLPGREARFAAMTRLISDFIDFTRMSLLTLVANSRMTCRNIAMNLVHYVTTPPIDLFHDRFRGVPAVVISAGPSLSRNLADLAAWKGRSVLIAVQTALKPLIDRGIPPDFITTLDFHEVSRQFFEGVRGLETTHLIAEPKATWHVLDDYPGPISILGNDWAKLVLGDELGARDTLPAGATVAHLAFYLAVYLGCDPIILVGQDLAFTGHVFYVPGVEIHRTWRSEINRFNSIEQKEWDRVARNRPILRKVPAQDGGELYTDELLFTYLEQFEKDFAGTSRTVINATEGGARIRGTESMSLRSAFESHAGRVVDSERWNALRQVRRRDACKRDAARIELQRRLNELHDAHRVCEELLSLLRELEKLADDPTAFNRRLIRIDELRTRIANDSRAYRIVNAATQLAELRRYSADRRIDESNPDETDRARQQIARDIEFISAVRDGTMDIQALLNAALERLDPSNSSYPATTTREAE